MNMAAVEIMAEKLAILMNGGAWGTHYTEVQRQVWRDIVTAMWGR